MSENKFLQTVKSKLKSIIPDPVLEILYSIRLNHRIWLFLPYYYLFGRKNNKYFLCRPRGGLNDILNRIEVCYRYCIKYGRKLYVDTSRSGFLDSFEKYFISPPYISFKKIDAIQYPVSVFPNDLRNDIYDYEVELFENSKYKTKGGSMLSIDLNKNYKEQYLVYESMGGGELSYYFIKRCKLDEAIRLHIVSLIKNLGSYAAIHIRNTDYHTDYKKFLEALNKIILHNKIIICTDDYDVQQYSKSLFGNRIVIPTKIPNLNGKSLHDNPSLDRYKTNIDALADLFILACSDKLHITMTNEGLYSGFGLLAMKLHKNKKIVNSLLYA